MVLSDDIHPITAFEREFDEAERIPEQALALRERLGMGADAS